MFDEKAVYIGAAEVCPIALVFNALDHIEHLPAIANLASDSAGGLTIEAFGSNACEIPAVMARVPAAVNANIVTDQVTGRGGDRQLQRIGLDRLWSEIRAKCGTAALIATMLAVKSSKFFVGVLFLTCPRLCAPWHHYRELL